MNRLGSCRLPQAEAVLPPATSPGAARLFYGLPEESLDLTLEATKVNKQAKSWSICALEQQANVRDRVQSLDMF